MGEYADYMLNGDDCQECGMYISEGDGYPRTCEGCKNIEIEDCEHCLSKDSVEDGTCRKCDYIQG